MKILITGGAGFIGSHLAEKLLELGHLILSVDNYETGRDDNLGDPEELIKHHNEDIVSDIFGIDFNWFMPDIVIHCAASYRDPNNWKRDAEVNCFGTANVCQLSKKYNVKRIIYLQTSLCYGLNPQRGHSIFMADQPYPIKIDCPLDPAPNSYAITKTAAERIIAMSGVPFISFRLANCYGPRNLSGPIPTFYKNLIEKKLSTVADTRRDFVYINDLVELLVRAVIGEGTRHYYHVSTGKDISIKEIFEAVWGFVPHRTHPRYGLYEMKKEGQDDVKSILLDPSETLKDFPGWEAKTPLEEGIKKAVDWYSTHKITETYTHLKKEN